MSRNQTSNASNVSTLPTTTKAQTAREVIAENVKLLIAQLEAGHSEGLTAYLTAMGSFHNYSFGNILEIARQKPDPTRVAGLHAWNQLGRKVMKGQKGIRILAPVIGIRKKKDSEAERSTRAESARAGRVPQRVRLRCVADRRRRASRALRTCERQRGREPRAADLDKLRLGCEFTVDVRGDLGLIAGCVKALIALYVCEEGSVVSAAAGAGDASSCGGVESWVLTVEESVGQREIKVRL